MTDAVDTRCDVLIAGGGFIGMALACALSGPARAPTGLKIVLVERAPPRDHSRTYSVGTDSRSSTISSAVMRMLLRLGLDDDLAAAQPISKMLISCGDLEDAVWPPLLAFETGSGACDGTPAVYVVPNQILLAGLEKAVAERPDITVLRGCRIVNLKRDSSQKSSLAGVLLDDGRTLHTSLLVAADGRDSQTRSLARIGTVEWGSGQCCLTGTVALEREHDGLAIQNFLPHGPFALLPLPGCSASLIWTERNEEAQRLLQLEPEILHHELMRRAGWRFGDLRVVDALQCWPPVFRLASSFMSERLALVGDAAHSIHPLAGQGINLGLKDVAALADSVLDAARLGIDIGSAVVLERYQRWRRFDVVMMSATVEGLNRIFSNDSGILRLAGECGLGFAQRLPALKEWMTREACAEAGTLPRLLRGEDA